MISFINKPPKRLFTFGCSFTEYWWACWSNIIGEELQTRYGTEFYNFGRCGIGNEAMLNMVVQADSYFKFNSDDLVMICYTNIARIDRWDRGAWVPRGNIFSSDDIKFLKQVSLNDLLVKNLAYIYAANELVKARGCQLHALQMLQVDSIFDQMDINRKFRVDDLSKAKGIYKDTLASLLPSFYDVLWNGDCTPRLNWFNPHPLPLEHLEYLNKIFNYEWLSSTLDKVTIADDRVDQQVQAINRTSDLSHEQQCRFFTQEVEGTMVTDQIVNELLINQGNLLPDLFVERWGKRYHEG